MSTPILEAGKSTTKSPDLEQAANELATLNGRLIEAASELEALSNRIYDPKPEEATGNADPTEPVGALGLLHDRTDVLSHTISRIVSVIGALRSLA